MNAGDWPKHGSGLGDGWEVAESTAMETVDLSTYTGSEGGGIILEEGDGEATSSMQWTYTYTRCNAPLTILKREVTN